MGGLNRNTKSLAGNMSFVTNAFRGWLGYLGVSQVARMSDEMQSLGNRLKVITGSSEGAADAFEKIAGIADRTNQSIATVGDAYNRYAQALKRSGATTDEVVAFTETLSNTFRIAGTSAAETANTMIQLGQAFSSGKLSGDELRSVMEQNGVLASILRERFGPGLAEAAKKGLVTPKILVGLLADEMVRLKGEADKLTPTFEQTLTKATNALSIKLKQLNEDFGLSEKFATLMGIALNNLGYIVIALAGLLTAALIPAVISLGAVFAGLAKTNLIVAGLTALLAVGYAIYDNWEWLQLQGTKLVKVLSDLEQIYVKVRIATTTAFLGATNPVTQALIADLKVLQKISKEATQQIKEMEEARKQKKAGGPGVDEQVKALRDLEAKLKGGPDTNKLAKLRDILAEINKEFSRTRDANAYFRSFQKFQLDKLKREFDEGRINLFKYNEGLRDLEIDRLERQFNKGAITLRQFNEAVDTQKFKVLKEQQEQGVISLSKYNDEVLKLESKFSEGSPLRAGIEGYIKSVGTLGENIAKGVTQAFSHLEDNLFEFTKTGKFEFGKFAQAILDDLTRIIIRMSIVKPFAEVLLNSFSGPALAATGGPIAGRNLELQPAAKGMAFAGNNVIPFARGGIVDSPTGFMFGGGRQGVMGEAGPEAILPLSRGPGGNLGVQASVTPVTINILNQSGAGVQQTESTGPNGERQIDILISSKVREGIVNGKYDSAMKSAYGVSRRGS